MKRMNKNLLAVGLLSIGIAFAGAQAHAKARLERPGLPILSGVLSRGSPYCPNYESGSSEVCHVSHFEAIEACQRQGRRLPTVRELARMAHLFGARGIRESRYSGLPLSSASVKSEVRDSQRHDYYPIFKQTASGRPAVDFYFDHSGYIEEAGLGSSMLWSSSVYPGSVSAYAFKASRGMPLRAVRSRTLDVAVRCVIN